MNDKKTITISKERQYKSMLQRTVPFVSKSSEWYKENKGLCIWCKVNPRIKATPDVLVHCEKCYILHSLKHDGTFAARTTIGIAKDLEDIRKGKVKVVPEVLVEKQIVKED